MTAPSTRQGSGAARALWIVWLAAFAFVLLRRSYAYGASLGDITLFGAYLALYVIVPGWLVYRLLRSQPEDWLFELGMGWTLGLALNAFAFVALKIAHVDAWFVWYPVVFVPFAALVVWRRRERGTESGALAQLAPAHLVGLMAILVIAIERQILHPMEALHSIPSLDYLFHFGNAAEFNNNWPLLDPRFAGHELNYHFFAYAFPAGASRVVHVPVRGALGCLASSAPVGLLMIQVFNAARLFGRSAAAGLVAASIVMFHADALRQIARLFGENSLNSASVLNMGIYSSVTTVNGLICFTTLAIVLHGWLGAAAIRKRSALPLLCVFGAMASGVKGSVMPIVLGGLGVLAAFELCFERRLNVRVLGALVALTVVAAPMTIFLIFGGSSYVPSMFHFAPAMAMRQSGLFAELSRLFHVGTNPPPIAWLVLLFPLWTILYLGIAGIGGCLSARSRNGSSNESVRWIWACVALGLGIAAVIGSPGYSQLFFLFNGQVGLAILGGAPIVAAFKIRSIRDAAWALLLALFAIPLLVGAARDANQNARRDAVAAVEEAPTTMAYREALAWMREHIPKDAVVVRREAGVLVSVYGERRAFNETAHFTPFAFDAGWRDTGGSLGPGEVATEQERERELLTQRFFARPAVDSARSLLTHIRHDQAVYVLLDAVRRRFNPTLQDYLDVAELKAQAWQNTPSFLELVFSNPTARIYRLDVRR